MGAVNIYKKGQSNPILSMDTVQNITFNIRGNVMDIPIPDEQNAWIMNLGGVSRNIKISWDYVSKNAIADIGLLGFQLINGDMFNDFEVEVEDWGLKQDCVISDISISQRKGEPNFFSVNITLLVGESIM